MPTHQLLNGLSGNLQSSTAWSQQQALELIQRNVLQALEGLDAEEKPRFLRLQRNALAALAAVETEKERVVRSFKADGLAQLRGRIGGRDPEQYRFDNHLYRKDRATTAMGSDNRAATSDFPAAPISIIAKSYMSKACRCGRPPA